MKSIIGSAEGCNVPPEWEPHKCVWIAWPLSEHVCGESLSDFYTTLLVTLSQFVHTKVVVLNEAAKKMIQKLAAEKCSKPENVDPVIMEYDNIWIRDYGPIFGRMATGKTCVIDFTFNAYGYPDEWIVSDAFHRTVAKMYGVPLVPVSLTAEGGAWENNGKNTVILTESVFFHRNPAKKREDIEHEFVRSALAKEVIWLKRGVPEDFHSMDGKVLGKYFTARATGGHTDEFVRFVAEDTVLLSEVPKEEAEEGPLQALAAEILNDAYDRLSKVKLPSGSLLKILKVPVPDLLTFSCKSGDGVFDSLAKMKFKNCAPLEKTSIAAPVLLAASYLNYLVTNGVVIAQKYWRPGRSERLKQKDEKVRQILCAVFPGRTVVQLDAGVVNMGGGGIHCITMQEPML